MDFDEPDSDGCKPSCLQGLQKTTSPDIQNAYQPELHCQQQQHQQQHYVNIPPPLESGSHQQRTNPSGLSTVGTAEFNDTPNSSPSRGKRFSSKKINLIWSTIKKFSPVQRLKNSARHRKDKLINSRRLYASHTDISCSDLAGLIQSRTKQSQDDMALILAKKSLNKEAANLKTFYEDLMDKEKPSQKQVISKDDCRVQSQVIPEVNKLESPSARQKLLSTLSHHHPFYLLEVHLNCARNLLAKDSCGTSDPYVKFKIGNRLVYKSRIVSKCLDPKWDEHFVIPIEDATQPIALLAYDYDFGIFQDDYLGATTVNLSKLELGVRTDLTLTLTETGEEDENQDQSWGEIFLTVTLIPKTQEDKEHYFRKGFKTMTTASAVDGSTAIRKLKVQLWDSVVNIVLVEGKDLIPKDENGLSDPYVKFRLGNEKYKSKIIPKTLNPAWSEQFDLHMYPDQSKVLEIQVYDKDLHGRDDFMGKCTLNLNDLEKEQTHKIWKELEDGTGAILLLVTISGTLRSDSLELTHFVPDADEIAKRYSVVRSLKNLDDIGFLSVKVLRAEGLAASDLGGTSDPFCVIELVNARVQTNTEYKTLSPEWNKIFTFKVNDLHSVLEVTIYDEDKDKKVEFLGKIAIPLLKIKNFEKKWYALKDKKLISRVKGQILLEFHFAYNAIKASIRTFNPREVKFVKPEQKFKRAVFVRNVTRVKSLVLEVYEVAKYINSCFQWESITRSLVALTVFLVITYFFELYMAPIALLLIFIKNYVWISIRNYYIPTLKEEEKVEDFDELIDDDEDELRNEEKKSLKEKLQTVQEVSTMIQTILGEIASCGERIKNTFDFSVPFLSWLAIICLSIASVIFYYIPLRYLILAWGINKFTKKLRSPNAIPNNELLDFLSRVPDDDEKVMFREYRVLPQQASSDIDKRKKKKTS